MLNFLKLVTGDELIADANAQKGFYILKNPIKIALTREGVAMMPFSPFLKSAEVCIKDEHILFVGELDEEVKNAYTERFGGGIMIPPIGLKVTD